MKSTWSYPQSICVHPYEAFALDSELLMSGRNEFDQIQEHVNCGMSSRTETLNKLLSATSMLETIIEDENYC